MKNIKIIGAGAGSGKTYRLADEVFNAIKKRNIPPGGILLTTFTKKAAAELKSRVAERLIELGDSLSASLIRQSLMGTVNSVCATILKEYAFACGLGFSQTVLNENEQERIFAIALSESITLESIRELDGLARKLDIENWRDEALKLAKAVWTNAISEKDLKGWAEKSCQGLFAGITLVEPREPELLKLIDNTILQLEHNINAEIDKYANTKTALENLKTIKYRLQSPQLYKWRYLVELTNLTASKKISDPLLDDVRELAKDHFKWKTFKTDICDYIFRIYDTVAEALIHYSQLKQKLGCLDFIDQERLCLNALENLEIRESLKDRVQLVLIDEFQDTSPLQLALFLKLADLAKESIWVGDPKQSIFGFRDTDPSLMLKAVEIIKRHHTPENLEFSWRSRPELVEFHKQVFQDVFKDQNLAAKDVVLTAKRNPVLKTPPLESWILPKVPTDKKPIQNSQTDAMQVAYKIKKIMEQPENYSINIKGTDKTRSLRYGDIAILARTNDGCDEIAESLGRLGVPTELSVAGLMDCFEVRLGLAGLRLMMEGNDNLAAAEITYLAEIQSNLDFDPAKWIEPRLKEYQAQLNSDGKEIKKYGAWLTHPLIIRLGEERARLKDQTPLQALKNALNITESFHLARNQENPRSHLANLEQLCRYAKEYEDVCEQASKPATKMGLINYLMELSEQKEDEKPTLGSNAVKIHTYHSSKGLEWPMVILFQVQKQFSPSAFCVRTTEPENVKIEDPLAGRGVLFWPYPYGGLSKNVIFTDHVNSLPDYDHIAFKQRQEQIRLLYVVFTRARDYLIFAARKGKTDVLSVLVNQEGDATITIPQNLEEKVTGWNICELPYPSEDEFKKQEIDERWFAYQPKETLPSGAVSASSVTLEQQQLVHIKTDKPQIIGERIKINGSPDMQLIGNVVHGYLGVNTDGQLPEDKQSLAEKIVRGMNAAKFLSADHLVLKGDQFKDHIDKMWPGAKWLREWPISLNYEGVKISGFIDLLLETKEGYIVIDHKTFPGKTEDAVARAKEYAGQLAVYSEAVKLATQKPILGTYIHFPISGQMVRVEVDGDYDLLREVLGC